MQRRASSWNGRGDGVGGAGGDAARAFAAMILLRRVRFQFQRRDDFREQNPVAELPADDIGVLADKAESGALGEVAFQQRPGVHIPQRAGSGAAKLIHECGQLFQPFAEHVVVIGELRVTRDEAG